MVRSLTKTLLVVAALAVAATSSVEAGNPNPAVQVPVTSAPPAVTTAAPISAGTPAPTPELTKKKKKGKKCASGLEAMPGDAAIEAESAAKIAAAASSNETVKAFASTPENEAAENTSRDAPAVAAGGPSAATANTKSGADVSSVGGGVVAAIVGAGVMVVGVAAVAFRRSAEERRRANTLRTPVEQFGQINATPAQVTVL